MLSLDFLRHGDQLGWQAGNLDDLSQRTMTKGTQLTERDLQIIHHVARFRYLTTAQLHGRFFSGSLRSSTIRLAALCRDGFLSRGFFYPKVSEHIGRPTAVYFFTQPNQQKLKDWLETNGQASRWEDFQMLDLAAKREFSHLFVHHETAISAFFLALEQAIEAEPKEDTLLGQSGWELVFWERTSPLSKEVGEKLTADLTDPQTGKTYTRKVYFNPDAFFCLKDPEGFFNFFFLEYDNNTGSLPKFRTKLEGYQAYQKQRKFPVLLDYYRKKYQLPIANIDRAGFRVLTITPDPRRRDALFQTALPLHSFKMLWFAALSELSAETIGGRLWMRGKEFDPIARELKTLDPETSPVLKFRLIQERLSNMPRVSLFDLDN